MRRAALVVAALVLGSASLSSCILQDAPHDKPKYHEEVVLEVSDRMMPPELLEQMEAEQVTEEQPEAQEPEPEEADEPDPEPTYSSGLTRSSGVNWYNGRRETYYSSRVLYHYMTPQWDASGDGVYRDSDGYVVVSSSDYPYGTVIETSFGPSKVYDTGCANGTVDIYVNW